MALIAVFAAGAAPYDGEYEFLGTEDLTMEDWEWVRKYTGYVLGTLDEEAMRDGRTLLALTICAMTHTGKITTDEFPVAWDTLKTLPFGRIWSLRDGATVEGEEDDAGPPASSSSVSESSSEPSSPTGSGKSGNGPARTGGRTSATSASAPAISAA